MSKIFYVEDSPDDITLLRLAFRKAGIQATLETASDGEKAVAALQNGAAAGLNCLLLDLKLPGMSGLQVLAWLRQQPRLKRLPVIVFTSSSLPSDINQAYELGANSYLVKPPGLDGLIEVARRIDDYWLRINAPPPNCETA